MALNKQPIFTATPILSAIAAATYSETPTSPTEIYADNSTFGTMINRITVTPNVAIGNPVTTSLVYLMVSSNSGSTWSVLKTNYFPAVGSVTVSTLPTITFTFNPSFILAPGGSYRLAIAVSDDTDPLWVVVEGSTYDV